MKDKITVETIKKAIKVLRKHKVEKPYWVEVENPIEKGDPLEDVLITPNKYDPVSVAKYGGVRFIVR